MEGRDTLKFATDSQLEKLPENPVAQAILAERRAFYAESERIEQLERERSDNG